MQPFDRYHYYHTDKALHLSQQQHIIAMKILIPTDFSANSKPGMRLAIQIAALSGAELVFIHVLNIVKEYQQKESIFAEEKKKEIELHKLLLQKFIKALYRSMKITPGAYRCEIIEGFKTDIAIMDYCRHHGDVDYISISTRGAGLLNKLLGTNTGNLIAQSPVPVIAVPSSYRSTPLKRVLYASDLQNYQAELNKTIEFAQPLKLDVEVLHFLLAHEREEKTRMVSEVHKNLSGTPPKIHLEINDLEAPLLKKLREQLLLRKPSIAVLFTKQNRTFIEKLFLSSMAEKLSFHSSVPILVFNKNFQLTKENINYEKFENMDQVL